jgi:hypothetical protein
MLGTWGIHVEFFTEEVTSAIFIFSDGFVDFDNVIEFTYLYFF